MFQSMFSLKNVTKVVACLPLKVASATQGGARRTQENDMYKLLRRFTWWYRFKVFHNNCLILKEEPR